MPARKGNTKLTVERMNAIAEGIKLWQPAEVAALRGGISEKCFYNWRDLGRDTREALRARKIRRDQLTKRERLCVQFLQKLEEAEAEAIAIATGSLIRAAIKDRQWRAAKYWLSSRHGRLFPQPAQQIINVQADNIQVQSPADIAAAMDASVGPPPAVGDPTPTVPSNGTD